MFLESTKTFLFDHIVSTQLVLFLSLSVGLWFTELLISTQSGMQKLRHTCVNYSFILTALPIQLCLTGIMLKVSNWVTVNEWGVAYLVPGHSSVLVRCLVGFVLMDLGEYFYHIAMHHWRPLWKFHLVHHCDPVIDVSTTTREHPCETVFRVTMSIVWVFISGASFGTLMLRQTVGSIVNILSHTSVEAPPFIEKILSWVIITPNLHHTHHHFRLPYTNSNYGDVFSIWDRLFGTHRSLATADQVYGVDTHMRVSPQSSFLEILYLPFAGSDQAVAARSGASSHPHSQPPSPSVRLAEDEISIDPLQLSREPLS